MGRGKANKFKYREEYNYIDHLTFSGIAHILL
jgi:hypothetical protein